MFHRDVTFSTERLSGVSDGVFAIILTLLVLELKIPELPANHVEQQMLADLATQIPSFVAWLISFVLVARIWVVHHGIIAKLERCHVGTIAWNFVLLGTSSLVPFGAGLIGTYEWDPIAVIFFSGIFGITGVSLGLLARHVSIESHLHRPNAPRIDLRFYKLYHAFGIPAVAILSVMIIPLNEPLAVSIWIVEPIVASVLAAMRAPA